MVQEGVQHEQSMSHQGDINDALQYCLHSCISVSIQCFLCSEWVSE